MSLTYLAEYAEQAVLALELAKKEAAHLSYTHRTLYAHSIDIEWVKNLEKNQDLAEKIDAFVGRFGRLQDHIGEKLIPRFAQLLGEFPKSLLDVLAYAEKMGWLEGAEAFVGARKLRNLLIHEYLSDPELFLESLQAADDATQMLLKITENIERQAHLLNLRNPQDAARDSP